MLTYISADDLLGTWAGLDASNVLPGLLALKDPDIMALLNLCTFTSVGPSIILSDTALISVVYHLSSYTLDLTPREVMSSN